MFPVHVVVGTPGRILDLMNKELIKTDACRMLVLDEVCQTVSDASCMHELSLLKKNNLALSIVISLLEILEKKSVNSKEKVIQFKVRFETIITMLSMSLLHNSKIPVALIALHVPDILILT